jgi:hypothetical protein
MLNLKSYDLKFNDIKIVEILRFYKFECNKYINFINFFMFK